MKRRMDNKQTIAEMNRNLLLKDKKMKLELAKNRAQEAKVRF